MAGLTDLTGNQELLLLTKINHPGFKTLSNIFEDSKGHLWVGTHVGGLFLFDRKTNTFKKFTEKDGLLYNGVLSINEDNANNLWITSDKRNFYIKYSNK